MKTLYIHIGSPKTATTSIQKFCMENRKTLKKYDLYFPVFSQKFHDTRSRSRNGHFLFAHMYDEYNKVDVKEEQRVFRTCLDHVIKSFSEYDNILLSDETIWYAAHNYRKNLWKTLKEEGEKHHFQVKIIAYLRRQDSLINSMYNQKVKSGDTPFSTLTFDEFLKVYPSAVYVDYDEGLQEISSVFGKENMIIRRFGKKYMKNQSIYEDFFDAIGLPLNEDFHIAAEDRNTAFSGNVSEIRRILNTISGLSREDYFYLRDMARETTERNPESKKADMFSTEEAQEFMEKYREGNRRVSREYFDSSEDLFETEFGHMDKWEWDTREMMEDMIRFMGISILELRQQNLALKEKVSQLEKRTSKQEILLSGLKDKLKHPVSTVIRRFGR